MEHFLFLHLFIPAKIEVEEKGIYKLFLEEKNFFIYLILEKI